MPRLDGVGLLHAFVLVAFMGAAGVSQAQVTTVPTGLSSGEEYRLAFVTSTTTDASSVAIGTYNAFVTARADSVPALLALQTTWTAIVSTATVAARDNTGTNPAADGVPIYLLNDTLLANDNADLWDGDIAVNLGVSENTSTVDSLVWTGTGIDGTPVGGFALGGPISHVAVQGDSGSSDTSEWIGSFAHLQFVTEPFPLYAISDVLTVPDAPSPVPSLGRWGLLMLACGLAAGGRTLARRA